jgi:diadenosine tetraphosphatase ApaH/serine/threonine PP2A family protein phosphatase
MSAYLVLSDIHSNLDALEAVLASAEGQWDRVLVLGDLVGYGGEPNGVIDRIRALNPDVVIRGNHDKAACGIDDASNFNQIAKYAALWTGETLTDDNREYLRALPAGPVMIDARVEICHGSPFDEDHYIFDIEDAQRAMETSERQLCLFGHTHLPVVFKTDGQSFDGYVPEEGDLPFELALRDGVRYVVNPGSVGQPRDGDARAAFALYTPETATLELRRVPYAVDAAQRKIIVAGLPASLANRLAVGR